jgi:Mannosyl-glycoprotein endo-beta-N-acetylglucosaminidase
MIGTAELRTRNVFKPWLLTTGVSLIALLMTAGSANAGPPPIRVSEQNRMPTCVTPERLMAFLRDRNPKLDSRFDDIAQWYKVHGEKWRVRWDYAFYQMIIETNHLSYRRGGGGWGDVNPKQNNFAGIGTTGGGVPGDGYKDVSTGVLAQIQHLVAYSGERMDSPVAPRTKLAQDDIIAISARLKRNVTFGDLAGRWAVDRRYARSIESIADRFRSIHCTGNSPIPDKPPAPAKSPDPPRLVREPVQVSFRQRSGLGASDLRPALPPEGIGPSSGVTCKVHVASYVGKGAASKTLLIKAETDTELSYTALQVLDGFERSMGESFIKTRAAGGSAIAQFESSDAALSRAYELCPSAR